MSLEAPFGSGPNLADSGTGLTAPFDIGSVVGSAYEQLGGETLPPGGSAAGSVAPGPSAGEAWSKLLKWLGVPSISDVVAMILGLLLVAAGIFLFKPVREAAATAVKTAAVVA